MPVGVERHGWSYDTRVIHLIKWLASAFPPSFFNPLPSKQTKQTGRKTNASHNQFLKLFLQTCSLLWAFCGHVGEGGEHKIVTKGAMPMLGIQPGSLVQWSLLIE